MPKLASGAAVFLSVLVLAACTRLITEELPTQPIGPGGPGGARDADAQERDAHPGRDPNSGTLSDPDRHPDPKAVALADRTADPGSHHLSLRAQAAADQPHQREGAQRPGPEEGPRFGADRVLRAGRSRASAKR